jgi:hypothetical protein
MTRQVLFALLKRTLLVLGMLVSGIAPAGVPAAATPVIAQTEPGGLTITGIAKCPGGGGDDDERERDNFTILNFATVDLFSCSALVASTQAKSDGSFTFNGAASGTVYQLRYTSNGDVVPTITCGTTVNTSDGVSLPDPKVCPDQSWDSAARSPRPSRIVAPWCSATQVSASAIRTLSATASSCLRRLRKS